MQNAKCKRQIILNNRNWKILYEEAQAGESRADFIHKMQTVLKELKESHFWIKLIIASELLTTEDEVLRFLFNEQKELASIIAKSVVTAKSKIKKKSSQS
jgi:four helix bundle protein